MVLAESFSNHPSLLWIHGMVWVDVLMLIICNCRWAIFPSQNCDVVKHHTCNYYVACPFGCDSQHLEALKSSLQDPERVFHPGPRPHMRQVVALLWSWHGIGIRGQKARLAGVPSVT